MPSWIEIASICLAALGLSGTSVALLHLYSIFFPGGCIARWVHPSDADAVLKLTAILQRLDEQTQQGSVTNSSLAEIRISLEDIRRIQRLGEEPVEWVTQVRRSPQR